MSEHAYEDVKVPARYRALLRRLQRGQWSRADLEWVLRTHPQLPPLVAAVVREKLLRLKGDVTMTQEPAYQTPPELRAVVAAKLPHILAQQRERLDRRGLRFGPVTADDVAYELPITCVEIVMVCPAFPFLEEECDRLDREGETDTDTAAALERVRAQWPREIARCNLLVQEVVAAGRAKGLQGEPLRDFIYAGMKPFTMGEGTT
jgi:hypothetical protein